MSLSSSVIVTSCTVVMLGLTVFEGSALGQAGGSSRCADCHFANPQDEPAPYHLNDWARSSHGSNRVGCEACHGGNPDTFESFQAHRGVLSSRNPAGPTHDANIPRTCGTCHVGPFVAFQDSAHFELLGEGVRGVPTCVTCHGEVGAQLLSPQGLERQCDACHGPSGSAPRAGRAPEARLLLEGITSVRQSLDAADRLIDDINDDARRQQVRELYRQAEVPLTEAMEAGHRFVFDGLQERLGVARQRAADLLQELVNPSR